MLPLQAVGGFDIKSLLPFALMFIVLYLFMIRPQIKKQKNEKKFQSGIGKGSKIVTTSGIHGKIVQISDKTVVVETGAGKIKFEKSSLSMEMSKQFGTKEIQSFFFKSIKHLKVKKSIFVSAKGSKNRLFNLGVLMVIGL